MVHLPGQQTAEVSDAPVSLMLVHDAVAAEIRTGQAPDLDKLAQALDSE